MSEEETINTSKPRLSLNAWHIIIIVGALIPLNYAIFVSLKSSLNSGNTGGNVSPADAIHNLLQNSKDNPTYETFLNLGVAYYNGHQYPEAIKAWESAAQYNGNSEIVYSNLGAAYGCLGKWEDEKNYCEKALAINPNFALARNNLKWALDELAKAGNPNDKKPDTNTGVLTSTAAYNDLLNRGLSNYNNKNYEEAIKYWKKALEINPNSELAYTNIGAAYGCLGKWREQVENCEKALAINPNYQLAINNLAWGKSELQKRGIKP